MRLKNLDLIGTVIIAALNVLLALLTVTFPVLRIILALPLVLVLPGYTLTEALFHRRSFHSLERLIFSLGLSLAIDVLGGLILDVLPIGLRASSWATFLGLLTALLSLLVAYLRRREPLHKAHPLRFRFSLYGCILFGLAITVAILSFLYATIGVEQQPHPSFTQLWMLPAAQTGKSCAVRLGVRSFESTSVTFRITMLVNGTLLTPSPPLVLVPQEEWDRLVAIPPGPTHNIYIEAQLYRLDKPEDAYREVHVTLNNCSTSQVSSTPYPGLTSAYNGTILSISRDLTTKMSLIGMQQSGGNIHGYFTLGTGLQGSDHFKGTVTATKQIHFTVTNAIGQAIFSFDGVIQSDSTLAGTYSGLNQRGQRSGDYGLWSVTPALT